MQLTPKQGRRFLKKLCIVTSRYAKRQGAAQKLDEHLKKLKKHSNRKEYHEDLSQLRSKISEFVQVERKMRYRTQGDSINEKSLQARLAALESELLKTRQEKENAVHENRKRIDDVAFMLVSLKKQIDRLSREHHHREQRKHHLENKILGKV